MVSSIISKLKLGFGRVLYSFKPVIGLRFLGAKIGKNVFVAQGVNFELVHANLLEIEDEVVVAKQCSFIFHDSSLNNLEELPIMYGKIILRRNSYLGAQILVLPGTEVGENTLIGAGSLLKGKYEKNSVYVGRPAKKVMTTSELVKKWKEKMTETSTLTYFVNSPKWHRR